MQDHIKNGEANIAVQNVIPSRVGMVEGGMCASCGDSATGNIICIGTVWETTKPYGDIISEVILYIYTEVE